MNLSQAIIIASKRTTYPQQAAEYEKYMKRYCKTLKALFPNFDSFSKPNFHLALHLSALLLRFGPAHGWWCYGFEHLIGLLTCLGTNNKLGKDVLKISLLLLSLICMLHSSNPNYSYAKVHLDCRIGTPVARFIASSSIEGSPTTHCSMFLFGYHGTLGAYESSFKDPAYLPMAMPDGNSEAPQQSHNITTTPQHHEVLFEPHSQEYKALTAFCHTIYGLMEVPSLRSSYIHALKGLESTMWALTSLWHKTKITTGSYQLVFKPLGRVIGNQNQTVR